MGEETEEGTIMLLVTYDRDRQISIKEVNTKGDQRVRSEMSYKGVRDRSRGKRDHLGMPSKHRVNER